MSSGTCDDGWCDQYVCVYVCVCVCVCVCVRVRVVAGVVSVSAMTHQHVYGMDTGMSADLPHTKDDVHSRDRSTSEMQKPCDLARTSAAAAMTRKEGKIA